MNGRKRAFGRGLLGATALAAVFACPIESAFAQNADDEIVVTARKRAETLQTVPLAIAAFTTETIENAGIDNVEDIASLTPGFTFAPLFGGGAATPVIRGQSTTIGEPNVGFFLDGVYQSSRAVMDAALGDDVARVEVVKGPQSALYGRNTFGGAVNIISRPPTNDLEGRVELGYGEYNARTLRGSVSGPIAEDNLYFRLGATYRASDGYFTNSLTGGDLDTRETTVIAGMLEARPSNDVTVRLRVAHEDTQDGDDPIVFATNNAVPVDLTGGASAPTFQIYRGELMAPTSFAVTPGHNNRELWASSLTLDWDFGPVTLTAISGYNDLTLDNAVDQDYSAVRARYSTSVSDLYELSQEIRLTSNSPGPLQWMAGGYFFLLHSDTHLEDFWDAAALPYASNMAIPASVRRQLLGGLINDLTEETESTSLFGQVSYNLTDRLRVSAEARWTTETKRVDSTDRSQLTGAVTGTYVNEREFENVLPRFTVDYRATDDILLYASAAQGEKVGGFNVVTVAGGILPSERTYDPESAWNYEIGAKTSWYDGRLVLNGAVYRIDWTDQIVRALGATFATLNTNAGETSVSGAELEMRASPIDGLDISAGVAYTDSHYESYTFGTLALLGMNPVLDGTRLQYVSEWQAYASLQYVTPITSSIDWFNRVDLTYQSDQSSVQTADAFTGDATILNLRTGFDYNNVSFRLFANNVTEEDSAVVGTFIPSAAQHLSWVQDVLNGPPNPTGLQAFGAVVTARPPRTVGASLAVRF